MAAGLILSGGASSRMGACKALLPWRGRTVIESILQKLRDGGCEPLLVVTGPDHERIAPVAEAAGAKVARNPRPERGMFSSIQTGLANPREPVLLCLVDQPCLTPDLVRRLIEDSDVIAQPRYHGLAGHPVHLPAWSFGEITRMEATGTLREFLQRHAASIVYVDAGHPLEDFDTPQEYQAALRADEHQ